MRLPKLIYREPESIEEASSLLIDEPYAKILAGGTDLLVNMKHRVEKPPVVINIKRIPGLSFIRQEEGAVRIGALTSLKTISRSSVVSESLPALAEAASSVGSYHHQTMGTLGGNLCQQTRCKYFNQSRWWRSSRPLCFKAGGDMCYVAKKEGVCFSTYCGDVAPALLVLNAQAVLSQKGSSRKVPLQDIYSDEGKKPLQLGQGEILTEIVIPQDAAQGFSTYKKFANRGSIDFPVVGCALWTAGSKGESRIAFTAVDRKPLRATQLEDFLKGRPFDEEAIQAVDGLVAKETRLMMSSIDSLSYKRKLMGLLAKGALSEAMGGR